MGVVMLVGTAVPTLALFKRLYQHVLAPNGLVKPDVITDNPEPHRFAQGFGGVVVTLAVLAFATGLPVFGLVFNLARGSPGGAESLHGILWLAVLFTTS